MNEPVDLDVLVSMIRPLVAQHDGSPSSAAATLVARSTVTASDHESNAQSQWGDGDDADYALTRM